MTLAKAIEILDDCCHGALLGISQETKDAIKLLIESGKRLQSARKVKFDFYALPLPGETE